MRHEWRFGARSGGWRPRCASLDRSRLPAQLTRAFVDRWPIGWTALIGRAQSAADRRLLESLWLLDRLRRPAVRFVPSAGRRGARAAASVVLALATLQTACCLGAMAIAAADGTGGVPAGAPLALCGGFAAASLLLAARTVGDRRGLFLLTAYACVAGAFGRAVRLDLGPAWAGLDPVFRGLAPAAFAPALFWEFVLEFPRVWRFTRFDIGARRAANGAWGIGGALFGINLAAGYQWISHGPALLFERNHPGNGFWHVFALATVPAVVALVARARRAPSPERRHVARFALAIAAGTSPFCLCGIARLIVPGVDRWFLAAAAGRSWVDGVVVGSLMATPLMSAVALIVDRPFDSRWSPGMTVRLAGIVRTAVTLGSFVVLASAFYRLRDVPLAELPAARNAWLLLASAAACVLALRGSRPFAWTRPPLFRPRPDDDREWLSAALERVQAARGAREAAMLVARELARATRSATACVLFPGADGAFVEPARAATRLAADTALLAVLRRMTTPLDLSDRGLRRLLPADEREWVVANRVQLAAAVRDRDGTIAAIVALASAPAASCDPRDRWLLTTLCGVASRGIADTGCATGPVDGEGEPAFECRRCGRVSESIPLACGCTGGVAIASLPRRLNDKFIVERRLDAGAMGVVYVGRDLTLDRAVALKTLPAVGAVEIARLREEARAMASLDHDALATIYGVEPWRGTLVLVEEYLPGGTLAARIAAGPLAPAAVARLGIHLADGLARMHAGGRLHRDLKPGNIAFTAAGTARIVDFGLAAPIEAALHDPGGATARPGPIAGTPAYLPPEAHAGGPPLPSLDLWALSVSLLEAMTGRNRFGAAADPGRARRLALADLRHVAGTSAAAAPLLHAFFDRALALQPRRRFRTAAELRAALEALALGLEA